MFKWISALLIIPVVTLLAEPSIGTTSSSTMNRSKSTPLVYEKVVSGEMDIIYKKFFTGLESNGYFVIFEPNIGKNLSLFAKRWGED